MNQRLRKFCALWLVTQILLPFTAPFPICDLSDLLSGAHHDAASLMPSNPRVEGDYALAPPLATTTGRLKLVVVSGLDVATVIGIERCVAPGRLLAAAFLGPRRPPELQPTVLRL
jgi:hypothetical protein